MRALALDAEPVRAPLAGTFDSGVATLSAESIREPRWWSPAELRSSGIVTTPPPARAAGPIAAGDLPDADEDLGV